MPRISVNLKHAIDTFTTDGDNSFELIEKLDIELRSYYKVKHKSQQTAHAYELKNVINQLLEEYGGCFNNNEKEEINIIITRLNQLAF